MSYSPEIVSVCYVLVAIPFVIYLVYDLLRKTPACRRTRLSRMQIDRRQRLQTGNRQPSLPFVQSPSYRSRAPSNLCANHKPYELPAIQADDRTDDELADQCAICLDRFHRKFTFQCGHGACAECLHEMQPKGRIRCHVCREPVKLVIQVYR